MATGFAEASASGLPNVIVILTDDQAFGDVGVHGNRKIRTPNLDRFAREGVRLTRFYCQPLCCPTRAGLMTGRYHYRTGVLHSSRGGAKMRGNEVTVAELLAKAGYATGIFGKWHLGNNYPMRPQDQGFDEVLIHRSGAPGQPPDHGNSYFDPLLWHNGRQIRADGYCADVFTDAAIRFIDVNRTRRFFVYLSTSAPHTPLEIAESYVAPYRQLGLGEDTAKVYGMLTNMDDNLGRLLAHLDELKLREETLIVFLSDNGISEGGPSANRYNFGLRGHKTWTYEGGVRVPCFVQWPGAVKGGRQVEQMAAHIDLLPTILDACGIQAPANLKLDGVSLLPALRGAEIAEGDRVIFIQCHRGLDPHRYLNGTAVTQRYKLIFNPGTFGRRQPVDKNQVELYDLVSDPGEQRNLSRMKPQVVSRLKAAYDRWFEEVEVTRSFVPGVMHLGPQMETPALLSRYQDGTYRGGYSRGWSMRVAQGRYEFRVKQPAESRDGSVFVSWLGHVRRKPAKANTGVVFDLKAGEGLLDIWWQADGEVRKITGDSSAVGDVVVRWRE